MFRPDNPLMPNYKYVPIGYHGRASSIVVSAGRMCKRPKGQNRSDAEKPPVFIPCKNLDYEMEVGFFVGQGNELGTPIPIARGRGAYLWRVPRERLVGTRHTGVGIPAARAVFGKEFCDDDLAVRCDDGGAWHRFGRRRSSATRAIRSRSIICRTNRIEKFGGLDINLEVYIQTEKMRSENIEPHLLSRSNMKDLYWTIGQMLTHHASDGCNLQTGDLMATGTVSGKEKSERGSHART